MEERSSESESVHSERVQLSPRRPKRNSYQRLSRLSDEARLSVASISVTSEGKGTDSNRSSATIRAVQINGHNSIGLNDMDFDKALRKFTSERDSFLTDLTFSAGAVVPNRPKSRPKTQKVVCEDANTLKSGVGSIRRRISFRDMNSVKRQPSLARQCG